MNRVNNIKEIPSSDKGKRIVEALYPKGIFDTRGAIDGIAKQAGVSKYTTYNYLREAKVETREEA